MGSLKSYHEKNTIKRDRGGDEGQEDVSLAAKRSCTTSPEDYQQQLHLLEDLYGSALTPELSILDCGNEEELVSEMMKSLEKVISPSDESPMSVGRSYSEKKLGKQQECASVALNCGDEVPTPQKDENASNELEVDIKFLCEASDHELGIPPSPNADGEKLGNPPQDALWLDASYPELADCENVQLATEVGDDSLRYGSRNSGWVGEGVELEGRMASERECIDLSLPDCGAEVVLFMQKG